MDAEKTSLYTAVLIVSVVLGTIITYFIISIVRQHRRSLQLYKRSIQTEIATLEKERVRMAADLHDEVGPVLSSIKLRIGSVDAKDQDDQENLDGAMILIDQLIGRMREITFDIMPNDLIRKGFIPAVKKFIDNCCKTGELDIQFRYHEISLSQHQSINLYRIVQELVHNTLKHAKATKLKIELKRENDLILFSTSDNGAGFNYHEKLKEAGGQGLHNLLSRTEMLGGKIYVESKKGKGTSFNFEIPLTPTDNHEH